MKMRNVLFIYLDKFEFDNFSKIIKRHVVLPLILLVKVFFASTTISESDHLVLNVLFIWPIKIYNPVGARF